MSEDVNVTTALAPLLEAFTWRADANPDQTWLAPGFDVTLRFLHDHFGASIDVLWLTTLLLAVVEEGGTCLALDEVATVDDDERLPAALRERSREAWLEHLEGQDVITREGHLRPLVEVDGRLYFERYFTLESRIAELLSQPPVDGGRPEPDDWATRVATAIDDPDVRSFALGVWRAKVSVLAGGPGTGKTTAVARLLGVLLAAPDDACPHVTLCAPTGKAATRMQQALQAASVDLDDAARARVLALSANTVHRTLGISPDRPRRDTTTYLHTDFVICDEASMVDLALMHELLASCGPETRVVLVGDDGQLPSIDAGSVLRDLLRAPASAGLARTRLTTVHRTSTGARDELQRFFTAVRERRGDDALALARAGTAVTFVDLPDEGEPDDALAPFVRATVERARVLRDDAQDCPPVASEDSAEWTTRVTAALHDVMVLTAQHKGVVGREWWVDRVAAALSWSLKSTPRLVGLPVLFTQTLSSLGVRNGDVGLVVPGEEGPQLWPSDRPASSRVPTVSLTAWQPWWAMTIHKSQGSEFGTVIVSLTPGSRLLNTELLYTAVTRARERVVIVARPSDFVSAVATPARRATGLEALLAAQVASHEGRKSEKD